MSLSADHQASDAPAGGLDQDPVFPARCEAVEPVSGAR